MNTTSKIVLSCIVLIVFVFASFNSVIQIYADQNVKSDHRVVILGIDSNSVVSKESHMEMVDSLIGIMSTIKQGDDFYLMTMDSPGNYIGPYRAGRSDFAEFPKKVQDIISNSEDNSSLGVAVDQTLGESYGLLDIENAPPGSGIYLIGTNEYPTHEDYVGHRLDPLSDLFYERGWHISTFALSGIPTSNLEVSTNLASATEGHIFRLEDIGGLKLFTDYLLTTDNRGKLISSGEKKLTFSNLLISDIGVLPGTEYVMALFFRESNTGSFRLKNPDGLEASTGDRSSSSVLETPNAVVWIINDPIPGNWTVDVTGINGLVSSWYLASNKYVLNFQMPEVVPTDEAATISAFITEAQSISIMGEDAVMSADVVTPGSTSITYDLKDEGIDGDLKSGDGYYSAKIPAPLSEGTYSVSIHLSWPDVKYNLTRDFTFQAEVFPTIEMDPLYTSNLFVGEEYTVATIYTKIKDYPYAVSPSDITTQIINDLQFGGTLKINPRSPDSEGKAWMYDVIFSPDKPGQTSTIFNVHLTYANRSYSQATENLILKSRMIPQAPAQPYSNVPYQPEPNTPPSSTNTSKTNIPLGIIIPMAILIIILIIIVLYRNSLPKPYGFISDESGNSVLNFDRLPSRKTIGSIFTRHVVTGSETGMDEFIGATFVFGKGSVLITATSAEHTIRINNHPLVGSAYVADGTWIGVTGQLFRFTTERTYSDHSS
ncbi:MAG: hypothetical protein FI704_08005 [SAR202 cluster bacterium]|nr:hypothetical protein [SAR202 cluster bacterium]